jgi:hypothetical protein
MSLHSKTNRKRIFGRNPWLQKQLEARLQLLQANTLPIRKQQSMKHFLKGAKLIISYLNSTTMPMIF